MAGLSVSASVRVLWKWTLLKLSTTTSQKCEAVPRRARIQGSYTCVSLKSRPESNKEEEEEEEEGVYVRVADRMYVLQVPLLIIMF